MTDGAAPGVAAPPANRIAAPEQFFGFRIGAEGKLAQWGDLVKYYKMVAQRSDKVRYQELGTTTMGLPFPVLTVSSPKNLANLDRIKQINSRLADPRGLAESEAKRLAAEGKPVYLLEAAIHSTEVGTAQVIPDVLHRLATESSSTVREILDNTVILIIPAQNPDGTKWVTDYFSQTAGTNLARTYPDLYHKYVGHDDNRDWFMLTQPETKISAALQNEWKPQVVQCLHQQGSDGSRIFVPPYLAPNDPNIDPITVQQTNSLGMEMSRSLTAEGKKGVEWGERYDYWTPSRQYMTYHGAPRMLVEAASARDLAYTYASRDGKPLGPQAPDTNFIEPYDQSSWSLAQIVDYLDTTVFAGLSNVAKYSQEWLFNFYRTQRRGVSQDGKPYAYVLPAAQRDPFGTYELLKTLQTADVDIERATAPFTANGKRYDAGSWIIKTAQPYGRFAKTVLEVQQYPDLRQYPGGPPQQPYDVTAQTLPMLLGVQVDTVQPAFSAATSEVKQVRPESPPLPAQPGSAGAYLVSPESYGTAVVIAALQRAGAATFRAADQFTAAGRTFAPGSLIVEPTAKARGALQEAATKTGIRIYGVAAAPRVSAERLKDKTRIGLYRGINNIPGGWMKWLFDQYGIGYGDVVSADFKRDLNDQYDTIVLPAGITKSRLVQGLDRTRYPAEWSWAYGIGEDGWQQLRQFVQDGGTLLAIGNSVATARELFSLPITPALPTDETKFYSPGSILSQRFDASDPVAWGMREDTPVWFGDGDQAYTVTGDADVVSSFPASGEQLQSGWLIGGEHLNGRANVVKHQVGKGLVVTFGSEPSFRTWSRDPSKLLFNAAYHGPATAVNAADLPAAVAGKR